MPDHSEEIGQPNPFDEHTRMWADEFYDFIRVQSHDEAAVARVTEAKEADRG